MKYLLTVVLIITTLFTFGQGNKVYLEAGSDEELKKKNSNLEEQKTEITAYNNAYLNAQKLESEYFLHYNRAIANKDEKEIDIAVLKLRQARDLMKEAHTKWIAYQKSKGLQIVSMWEANYTDKLRTYDQWLSPKHIEDIKTGLKPVTELYLVKPENKVITINMDQENLQEDFWVVGEPEKLDAIEINGRKIYLKNFTFERFMLIEALFTGYSKIHSNYVNDNNVSGTILFLPRNFTESDKEKIAFWKWYCLTEKLYPINDLKSVDRKQYLNWRLNNRSFSDNFNNETATLAYKIINNYNDALDFWETEMKKTGSYLIDKSQMVSPYPTISVDDYIGKYRKNKSLKYSLFYFWSQFAGKTMFDHAKSVLKLNISNEEINETYSKILEQIPSLIEGLPSKEKENFNSIFTPETTDKSWVKTLAWEMYSNLLLYTYFIDNENN